MRLQNRLNQYQRLYLRLGDNLSELTVAELAEIFCCSERHTRTLLSQFQHLGWISWHSQAGRSKRGKLHCLKTPESLRETYVQELLNKGDHSAALQLSALDPQHLNTLLAPHMGGQWLADAPTLRIPYYRPMQRLDPQTLTGRAEQHLAHTIHAGLTRFITGQSVPQPDMAHHWHISNQGKTWQFFLHSRLYWHNGELITASQLGEIFERLRHSTRSRHSLDNIRHLSQPHALCLQFDLHHADYWLAHRLADLSCLLPHPHDATIGAGPFRLVHFAPELVRLEQHTYYHLQRPFLHAIEYWISPHLFAQKSHISCQHPVRIILGEQDELAQVRPIRRTTSLGFCYLAVNLRRGNLSNAQAQKIVMLLQRSAMLEHLPIDNDLVSPSKEMLPGWPIPRHQVQNVRLPATLNLMYHPPVELGLVAEALKALLAAEGCVLTLTYHTGRLWDNDEQLGHVDLMLGDRLIGEAPQATLENWLRQDPLWPAVLSDADLEQQGQRLSNIAQLADSDQRTESLRNYFYQLMVNATITPLFNYRYQVSAPPRVNGVQLTAWGWFDFCQAWIPPDMT